MSAVVDHEQQLALFQRQLDPSRYLGMLTNAPAAPSASPGHTAEDQQPDDDVPREPGSPDGAEPGRFSRATHPVLGAPTTMITTASNTPDPDVVRHYLAHSCDLVMSGGPAAALTYPLAACALAEHYVFRRIGGTSAAAVAAAVTAAAELGRGQPGSASSVGSAGFASSDPSGDLAVRPGFAGLAEVMRWLAEPPPNGEGGRFTRLFQPSAALRPIYRVVVAALRPPGKGMRERRGVRLIFALLSAVTGPPRWVLSIVWLGALVGWAGASVAVVRAEQFGAVVDVLLSIVMLATAGLAASAASALCVWAAARDAWRGARVGTDGGWGLIAGVEELPDQQDEPDPDAVRRRSDRLAARQGRADHRAGVLDAGEIPPLFNWIADRIDDLAAVPPTDQAHDRYAVTFGELWLGRLGSRSPADTALLRRAAHDRQLRVIDLELVSTNVAEGRPYTLPFADAERSTRDAGSRFSFCHECLVEVLPARVVEQMILMSPGASGDRFCPRHAGGRLHDMPEPWDLPIVAAVRLSASAAGALRAVPLFTLPPGEPVRTHWFCDGSLSSAMPVNGFHAALPRWPTFGLTLDTDGHTCVDLTHTELEVPEQDAAPRPRTWRPITGLPDLLGSAIRAGWSWQDALHRDSPGVRGRIAHLRVAKNEPGEPGEPGWFLSRRSIVRLAIGGLTAGITLRERFTGPDGVIGDQTQTDRFRWVQLRMALREYRSMSLAVGASGPLYNDLSLTYKVPAEVAAWFTPPLAPGGTDPAWGESMSVVTHLRALADGGVLDWDTDYGAPPLDPDFSTHP